MKKIYYKLFIYSLLIFLMSIPTIVASAATIKMTTSSSTSTIVVGKTFTVKVVVSSNVPMGAWGYTVSYNTKLFKLISGKSSVADVANSGNVKSVTYSYSYKAIASGTGSIGVKSYEAYIWENNQKATVSPSSKSIKVITQSQLESSYSSNNYLSSLSVSGYSLSPAFNKDVTSYKVTLNPNVEKITINATKADKTASISGTGTKAVSEGENKISVVVTSQKGTKRTYTIIATVIDKNPIKTTINNVEYTIIKRSSLLKAPSIAYQAKTININGQNIPAFYSEITDYTLVGIKDSEGNIFLGIYDEVNNKYTPYQEIEFEDVTFYALPFPEEIKDYIKTNITINGVTIIGYKYDKDSKYALLYGINVNTGKKSIYMYDSEENTIQRYNNEEIINLYNKNKDQTMIIYYLIAGILLELITVAILVIRIILKNKKRKKSKNELIEDKKKKSKTKKNN